MQRNTGNTQTLTIEYGFLDSKKDDVNQLKNNYKNLAEAVVRAVTNYIGVPYKPVFDTNTYIVQKGDTLYSIANRYNTTVNQLKELNNLVSNALSIGQVLYVKTNDNVDSNINGNVIYTVQKGDTLYSISKEFKVSIEDIKKINNLNNDILRINQKLIIPIQNPNTYIVQKGDTLYSIARKNNITVDEIKRKNNLNTNLISLGQILYL